MYKSIAIDGPSGAGKSTIAKIVSKKLGYIYIDTGAMYRAMAYYYLKKGLDVEDEIQVNKHIAAVFIDLKHKAGEQLIFLNGENITQHIREEDVSQAASKISVHASVRNKLVELQRKLAEVSDVVMDGRDIGTQVLPNADIKIYLTASVSVRAMRRYRQLLDAGHKSENLSVIERDIEERDYRDTHRSISPLRRANDAVYLDSSDMSIEEVVDTIIQLV